MTETLNTEFPTCPHCGEEDQDWTDGCDLYHDGDSSVWECSTCGKKFDVEMSVSYTFSTNAVTERDLTIRKLKEEINHFKFVIPLLKGDKLAKAVEEQAHTKRQLEELETKTIKEENFSFP